ncbi:MAG: homoserine dehydrogenase [Alphaproteobacteria bacterium]|nr:homoserine dehydrogenase [Alphaproteobacteria bacterium]
MSQPPLNIGIAGLGTVGIGTLKLLHDNAALIGQRSGCDIQVVAVSSRDKSRERGVDISALQWHDNPLDLVHNDRVDVIVELIGGAEGVAKSLCEAALEAGKSVVTANKALIAHHGFHLAQLAEKHNAALAFEAAVAGGIPIIQALRTGLGANRFLRIEGILNGTSNYILSTMRNQGRDFDDVLTEAQKLGYAEADPSFDIDGVDAAHKLAIISSLAYGCPVDFTAVHIEGIRSISASDMLYAKELGYVIKLLGITAQTSRGIEQRVHPCFVEEDAPIAKVDGAYNAVVGYGDAVGTVVFEGKGAGAGPTASSVVSDLIDIARGGGFTPFTIPTSDLKPQTMAPMETLLSSYYIRLDVVDKPGVLADVTGIFREHAISMRSFVQHSRQPGEMVEIALTTHEARESAMEAALQQISALDAVMHKPQRIRIETPAAMAE